MHGTLIPKSGGRPRTLTKERHLLGRVRGSDPSLPLTDETACCALQSIDGWWHIIDLNCPSGLKVNGRAVKRERLMPRDEFEISRRSYQIVYDTPKLGATRKDRSRTKRPSLSASSIQSRQSYSFGRLVPLAGGTVYQLTRQTLTIGRRDVCDIVISAKTISGRHCELNLIDGYWKARDLGSHNGIRIDSRRCDEGWVLPGHRLSLAGLKFKLEYEGEGPPPAVEMDHSEVGRPLMDRLGLSENDFDDADHGGSSQRRGYAL